MSFSFIMAVDPGITTGIAYGVVDHMPGASTEDLLWASAAGVTVEQVWDRDEIASGIQIATLFMRLRDEYLSTKKPKCVGCHLVVEDFLLRARNPSMKREVLAPVRVTAAIETMLVMNEVPMNRRGDTTYTVRSPQMAMTYATNERLRQWEIFNRARGKPHGRDALRHWCTQVAKLHGALTTVDGPQRARRVRRVVVKRKR